MFKRKLIAIPILILLSLTLVSLHVNIGPPSVKAEWSRFGAWDTIRQLLGRPHTWTGTQTFDTVDINGGTIDGTTIGASSETTGKFTTVDTGEGANELFDMDQNVDTGASPDFAAITEGSNAVPNSTDNLSFFAATTSLQFKGVLSDETGSGLAVFATSPALVTPTLGVAAATALNIPINTLTDEATIDIDFALSNNHEVTLTDNRTYTFSNIPDGAKITLLQTQDGGGTNVPVWPATAKFPGGVTPTPSAAGGALDIYTWISDGTNLYLVGFAADVK
ncbi:MAG TPA: hypothetical protein ENI27_06350 [bacterium]|nr:hypothetical protein [bacterium]